MSDEKPWLVTAEEDGNRHISPVLDLREHEMTIDCWCHPRRDPEDPGIIIHSSLDGRETHELH